MALSSWKFVLLTLLFDIENVTNCLKAEVVKNYAKKLEENMKMVVS